MSMEIENSLPITEFRQKRNVVKLQFQNDTLVCHNAQLSFVHVMVNIQEILSVKTIINKNKTRAKQFKIYYVKHKKKNKWVYKSLKFVNSNPDIIETWVETLKTALNNLTYRPKKLLLFINPYGGDRTAMEIFEKQAKPIFKIAEVDVSVIVSQKQHQIREMVLEYNLDMYDAVACVGGDGTLSEVINGLVLRECMQIGLDPNNRADIMPKPTIPVGVIPGGSTDTTAYCIHGTTDQKTAAIHIALGLSVGLDLVTVHTENRLLQIFADVVSYGYLGDIAHFSSKLRWMGPSRYEFVGIKKFIQNKGYMGELNLLCSSSDYNPSKCYENCPECVTQQDYDEKPEYVWKSIKGKFFMVSGANISCAGKRNPNGLAPYSHLGDGYLNVIVIYHTSFFKSLQILNKMTSSEYKIDDMPEIEVYRCKEFNFCAAEDVQSFWSCDGEVLDSSNIHARVHSQLLTVFGRGPKEIKK